MAKTIGIDIPSIKVALFHARYAPAMIPKIYAINKEKRVNIIEFGKASIIISITGLLYVNDKPKSPLRVFTKNKEYCSKRDLSKPNL